MSYQEVMDQMHTSEIIPVVAIKNSEDAVGMAKAFLDAGLKVIEITLRTEAGIDAIRKICESGLDCVAGAGTVLSVEMAQKAVDAGAQFIISPGFDEAVVGWCNEHEVPVLPGVATPSEVIKAMNMGLKVVKLFPAEVVGGVKMLKSLKGPFAEMKFVPTGGISAKNVGSYLALPNVVACGGSWICPADLIAEHKWDEITKLCKEAKEYEK